MKKGREEEEEEEQEKEERWKSVYGEEEEG